MVDDQISLRLDRLERRQQRLTRAAGLVALLIASTAVAAASRQSPPLLPTSAHPLRASSFELVDAGGRTRAVLRIHDGQPTLELFDITGATALRLTVRGADGSIEYADGGQILSLMRPALRAKPLTSQ